MSERSGLVIIPAYNEAQSIPDVVRRLKNHATGFASLMSACVCDAGTETERRGSHHRPGRTPSPIDRLDHGLCESGHRPNQGCDRMTVSTTILEDLLAS